jgi:heme/copper-type cytochrome/quinol oxidase subunit 2
MTMGRIMKMMKMTMMTMVTEITIVMEMMGVMAIAKWEEKKVEEKTMMMVTKITVLLTLAPMGQLVDIDNSGFLRFSIELNDL